MKHQLSPGDRALYQAVDEVLHYIWDPIGVAGVPQARDEYQGYVPHVFGMLREDSDSSTIAKYLSEVSVGAMGLRSAPEHDLKVAKILIAWRDVIREQAAWIQPASATLIIVDKDWRVR
jgi:hypothetical protein